MVTPVAGVPGAFGVFHTQRVAWTLTLQAQQELWQGPEPFDNRASCLWT